MTDRELKKLSRIDLVEMLLALTRENEQLRQELTQTKQQLDSKMIEIENAGSLAEAALKLNNVFEAAQAACEQYADNLRFRVANQRVICDQMERESKKKCQEMLEDAKQEADAYWEYVRAKVRDLYYSQGMAQHGDERDGEQ